MIPELTKITLDNYRIYRLQPGSFVKAVLSNDLYEAMARADSQNLESLKDIVIYITNYFPPDSYGSLAIVEQYLQRK